MPQLESGAREAAGRAANLTRPIEHVIFNGYGRIRLRESGAFHMVSRREFMLGEVPVAALDWLWLFICCITVERERRRNYERRVL